MRSLLLFLVALPIAAGCIQPPDEPTADPAVYSDTNPGPAWALAIHGGAGVFRRDIADEEKEAYLKALRDALALGRDALDRGEASVEVVENVVRFLEDAPQFNAGKGSVFTHDGGHELDAAIMDGASLGVGAVTGVRTVKNPISLARMVMEKTPHVLLSGAGAEAFADQMGVDRVDGEYFFSQERHNAWQRARERELAGDDTPALDFPDKHGTVGAVARDRAGHLAAATSTGGLTNKRWGRVGDVPIIGAGTYANDAACAVSGTGIGEQFIRHTVAADIASLVAYGRLSLVEAVRLVIHDKLEEGDGGVIAVDRHGNLALVFNTSGMYRGAADATGRFDVAIWE